MRLQSATFLFIGLLSAFFALAPVSQAIADIPKTLSVKIEPAGADGETRFYNVSATIRHADTGWDHYCNRFEVLDAATGRSLGERVLAHPHEDEQPFTRMLYRMPVPPGVTRVRVRAHDSVHGYEPEGIELDLPVERG